MKFLWDKKLKPNTKVKLITKKHRHFTSISGKVKSYSGGEITIKGDDGKEYVRNAPQRIFLKEKSELEFPVKKIIWQGIPIEIENPAGSVRRGQDRNGKSWSIKMLNHYGRIPNTEGLDSDCIDIYLNAQNPKTNLVFKIHTKTPDTGEFDESKYMLGFKNQAEAEKAFRNSYDKPEFFGHIEEMPFNAFKRRAMKDQLTENLSLKKLIPINESISTDIYKKHQADIDKLLSSIVFHHKDIHNGGDAALALIDVLKYFY
jgi:hypothetical protein